MKKLLLLLLPLAIASCNSVENAVPAEEMGNISFRFEKSGMTQAALPDPSQIRLAVTNSKTGYKIFKDLSLSESQAVNIPVPAETGYLVEAVSYRKGDYYDHVLKYGAQSNVQVESGKSTEVILNLQRPTFTVSLPSSVTTGQKFTVSVNEPFSHPFNDLRADVSNQPTTSESVGLPTYYRSVGTQTIEINAPESVGSGKVYLQIYSLLDTERFGYLDHHLRFDISDVSFGDAPISVDLVRPQSGIDIVIRY